MTRAVSAAGGEVRVGCEVADVAKDGDGFTLSVRRDGETVTVRTRARARDGRTPGRPGGQALARQRRRDGAAASRKRVLARRRRRIATALGGRINTANKGFYGHLWAAGVEPLAPFDFVAFTFYQSEEGVMFDASGRRFAEETRGDHNNTMALAEHGGHALLLWSEEVQERAGGRPFVGGSLPMDRWGFSRDRGGRVASAADASELLGIARDWGYGLDGAPWKTTSCAGGSARGASSRRTSSRRSR